MGEKAVKNKQKLVDELSVVIKDSSSTFLVEYRGLTVSKLSQLRNELRKDGNEMTVYKNSVVVRAVNSLGYNEIEKELVGPNALVFSKHDPVSGARVITQFAKKNKMLVLKSAVVEGKVVSVEEIKTLSTLTDKEGMISMLLGCLKLPITKFACTLSAVASR